MSLRQMSERVGVFPLSGTNVHFSNKPIAVEECPNGYPRLAAFQSTETNFAMFRGFNYLHTRVLLDMQDELTALEHELDDFDMEEDFEDSLRLKSREVDIEKAKSSGESRTRRDVLLDIKSKLREYSEYFSICLYVSNTPL